MQYTHTHKHTHAQNNVHFSNFLVPAKRAEACTQASTHTDTHRHTHTHTHTQIMKLSGHAASTQCTKHTVNNTLLPLLPDLLAGERAAKYVQVDSGNRHETSNNTDSCTPVVGTGKLQCVHTHINVQYIHSYTTVR